MSEGRLLCRRKRELPEEVIRVSTDEVDPTQMCKNCMLPKSEINFKRFSKLRRDACFVEGIIKYSKRRKV